MMANTLKFLTIDDQALMIESSRRVAFPRGADVIKQGDDSGRALYTICSGVARVEVNGMAIAHLGPGALIGEMAFLERSPASASVVAHTVLGVDAIDSEHLHTLLASVPGFATRFYASLAALVSQRLRTASHLASSANPGLQLGSPVRRQRSFAPSMACPDAILDQLDAVCTQLAETERQARTRQQDASAHRDLNDRVASACERLHKLVTDACAAHPEQAVAIGGHIHRWAFPYLMTSRIHHHAITKPHGYDGDGELLDLLHENRPIGDGAFGAAVDSWVLARPFARALRERGAWLMQSLSEFTETWRSRMSVPVTYLATGDARDLLNLMDHPRALDVTCCEMDAQALQNVARQVQDQSERVQVSFVQTNMLAIGRGSGHTFLHLQKIIIAGDILNRYSDDAAAIALLDWIHDRLRPDGAVIMGQFRPDHADRSFLEHLLQWQYCYRDCAAIERLFAASRFKHDLLSIERHEDGVQMRVVCRRRESHAASRSQPINH